MSRWIRISIRFTAALVILYAAFVFTANNFLIPKVVIPKVRELLESGLMDPLKISVGNIHFSPVSGFLLKDVRLYTRDRSSEDYIALAESVDIDLDWLSLLRKRVVIKSFDMVGAEVNISRDSSGKWNLEPVAGLEAMDAKKLKGLSFDVENVRIINGSVNYSDSFKPSNSLKRRFVNVSIFLKEAKEGSYKFGLSARTAGRAGESAGIRFCYDRAAKSLSGTAKVSTTKLGEYWDYYLDDLIKPWHLKAEEVKLDVSFSSSGGVFLMDSKYSVKGGDLSFGDFHVKGPALIEHKMRFANGIPDKSYTSFGIKLKRAAFLAGKNILFDKCDASAVIGAGKAEISNIEGELLGKPVSLSGVCSFGPPFEMSLGGEIAGIDCAYYLKTSPDDRAQMSLEFSTRTSKLSVKGTSANLKDLNFDLDMEGGIDLGHLSGFFRLDQQKLSGEAVLSGKLSGEADNISTLNGKLSAEFKDFSLFDIRPKSFSVNTVIKDGVADGKISCPDLYGGEADGRFLLDAGRWGVEINFDKCDIAELAKENGQLEGMKGIFSADFACVGYWKIRGAATGGGYLLITDCNLKKAPIFKVCEEGMKTVVKNFTMPDFRQVRANFGIGESRIKFRALCGASILKIEIQGNATLSGETDILAAADMSGIRPLKIARQVMLPGTIGLDLIKDGIEVRINGKWPNLEQRTAVKPLRGLNEIFSFMDNMSLCKYSLDELWKDKHIP